jgi:hypothetical protein
MDNNVPDAGVMGSEEILGLVAPPAAAVSWPAIFGGAVAAASITLVLLALGAGLGLAAVSPWPDAGASALSFTVAAGIWLIVVQWLSSGIGGYVTGRLRVRWDGVHAHEVFFRDTAHGFLTWALASVAGAAILGSLGSAALGNATQVSARGAAATPEAVTLTSQYGVEAMLRGHTVDGAAQAGDMRAQATRILMHGMANGGLSGEDHAYLTQLVAARAGISAAEAERRVDGEVDLENAAAARLRQAADAARKSASMAGFCIAISMLTGAFIASAAAALGGAGRDKAA